MFFSIHEKIAFTSREIKSARRQRCVVCKENNVTDSTLGNGVCKFCGDIFILVGLFLSHGGKLETCTQLSNPTEMPPGKWMKPFCQYGIDVSNFFIIVPTIETFSFLVFALCFFPWTV